MYKDGRSLNSDRYTSVGRDGLLMLGRKTGAKLKDDGKRDSQGMMPTEGLFSSPGGNATQKLAVPTENPIPEATPPPDGNDDASVPMDIASSKCSCAFHWSPEY